MANRWVAKASALVAEETYSKVFQERWSPHQ